MSYFLQHLKKAKKDQTGKVWLICWVKGQMATLVHAGLECFYQEEQKVRFKRRKKVGR